MRPVGRLPGGRPDAPIALAVVGGIGLGFGETAALIRYVPTVLPPGPALGAIAAGGFASFMLVLFAAGTAVAYRRVDGAERLARAGERGGAAMGRLGLVVAGLAGAAVPPLLVAAVGGPGLLALPAAVAAFWWRASRAHAARLAAEDEAGPVGRRGT